MKEKGKKIGQLIKKFRKAKGISQMGLADMLGVSYQQIQKYEKGISKISVGRLEQISKALDIPINSFFQSEKEVVSETPAVYGKMTDDEQLLLQLFRRIKNEKSKNAVLEFLRVLVK